MAPVKNLAWAMFLAADFAAAHSIITNAVGNAGGSGMALGVDSSTPRDGTNRNPFQQDATRFRGASAETFGETLKGGDNNLEQGTTDIMEETGDQLPQITPGGNVQMTIHQVNSDGAGPYTCMINADGTGTTWDNIPVTTNVEGNERGRNRDGEMQDFPLVASIPQGQTCTGTAAGEQNVCLVRCQNPARAGPFGGVVPVQMAQAGGNTGNVGAPAGNVGAPAGNVGAPAGNVGAPQGNVGAPQGNVGAPQGNVGAPAGNVGAPQGNVGAPQGNVGAPQGNVGAPQGNVGAPQGNVGAPQGNVGAPQGNTGNAGNNLLPGTGNETPIETVIQPQQPGSGNGTTTGDAGNAAGNTGNAAGGLEQSEDSNNADFQQGNQQEQTGNENKRRSASPRALKTRRVAFSA
ncbi:CAS1-like protein [Sarocladium implicatum]|nr:CAS1-like protein [Sarocladium implicatum]